ncbi:MAG: hypothetical protein ACR2J4_10765 [Deinococcus sp.]
MRKPRHKYPDRSDGSVIFSYLQHWACFHCRKTFKSGHDSNHPERLCPQCRALMTNMGTDFKAPAQYEVKQWRKVQLLAQAGIKFFPRHRSQLPGEHPATLADVPEFLRKVHPPSEGERLLERVKPQRVTASREGQLVQHGDFPQQSFSLLGRPLESGTALEVFDAGRWKRIEFVSKGNGGVPIPQPFAHPHLYDMRRVNSQPLFLTPQHRLRWPE